MWLVVIFVSLSYATNITYKLAPTSANTEHVRNFKFGFVHVLSTLHLVLTNLVETVD